MSDAHLKQQAVIDGRRRFQQAAAGQSTDSAKAHSAGDAAPPQGEDRLVWRRVERLSKYDKKNVKRFLRVFALNARDSISHSLDMNLLRRNETQTLVGCISRCSGLALWLLLLGVAWAGGAQVRVPPPAAPASSPLELEIARGSSALAQGEYAGAEQAFQRALALDPRSVPLMNNLAIALARQGKGDQAITLYLRALQLQPGDPVTQRNLGVAYFRAKRYGDALPLLQHYAAAARTYQALDLTGFDLFALERYAEAVPYLEQAHTLSPQDLETLDMLGKAYLRTKNYAGMTTVFQQMMEINPASPEAHAMLAMAYDKLYRETDAIREFQAALAADAGYPGIHTGLGVIYWRTDQLAQAQQEFREELVRHPEDPVANCILGRILRRQNNPSEAARYLQQALAINPSYRDALVELGQAKLSLGDANGAIVPLRRAVELDTNDAEAHYMLGTALNQIGMTAAGARERGLCGAIREREREARRAAQQSASK